MQTVTTIGLDIAKSVFQVHGVDAVGQAVIRRQLKRRYVLTFFQKLSPCLVGIEACGSAHHWSRELQALGHTVRLMPPAYVKPYVKRQKDDATDAEAICEAVTRTNTRFVPTKTPEQQSGLVLHRARHLFIRQQTSVINAIRAHFAEFGIVARCLFVAGALSVIRYAKIHGTKHRPWLTATADQGCGYRACQQNRANGLGHDGQGRAIQGTRRACAINEIAPGNWRDVKVGRANST
jgi:hypothetical protein